MEEEVIHRNKDVEILENVLSATDIVYAYMDRYFNFIRVNRAYAEADDRGGKFLRHLKRRQRRGNRQKILRSKSIYGMGW